MNNRKYPESDVLTTGELLAVELHLKLDKKHGYIDKRTWPKWLAEKFDRAINNPYKGVDIGNKDKTAISLIDIEEKKIINNFLF